MGSRRFGAACCRLAWRLDLTELASRIRLTHRSIGRSRFPHNLVARNRLHQHFHCFASSLDPDFEKDNYIVGTVRHSIVVGMRDLAAVACLAATGIHQQLPGNHSTRRSVADIELPDHSCRRCIVIVASA